MMKGYRKRDVMTIYTIILILVLVLPSLQQQAIGIKLVIGTEMKCFSSLINKGEKVHTSFDIIPTHHYWGKRGLDLEIKGPNGEEIHNSRNKFDEMVDFEVKEEGNHSFCITNNFPHPETIYFDIETRQIMAIHEQFFSLFVKMRELDEILNTIQNQQMRLQKETHFQAIENEKMNKRAIQKAIYETTIVIGASVLQLFTIRELFERKLRTSIV